MEKSNSKRLSGKCAGMAQESVYGSLSRGLTALIQEWWSRGGRGWCGDAVGMDGVRWKKYVDKRGEFGERSRLSGLYRAYTQEYNFQRHGANVKGMQSRNFGFMRQQGVRWSGREEAECEIVGTYKFLRGWEAELRSHPCASFDAYWSGAFVTCTGVPVYVQVESTRSTSLLLSVARIRHSPQTTWEQPKIEAALTGNPTESASSTTPVPYERLFNFQFRTSSNLFFRLAQHRERSRSRSRENWQINVPKTNLAGKAVTIGRHST